ncbi:hypothetical protein Tco_0002992 [Tanacetum coccineum]
MPTEMELTLEQTQQGVSYEVSYDESNTYVLERFNTTAGNPVKKILLKLNLSDHRLFKDGGGVKEFQRSFCHSNTERLSRSDEVLKLKNFKKDATLKLSKSTNQERFDSLCGGFPLRWESVRFFPIDALIRGCQGLSSGNNEGSSRMVLDTLTLYLESQKGRVIDPSYLGDQPNLHPTFAAIGFDCLLDINEKICPAISSLPNGVDSNPNIYPPPHEDPLLIRDALFYHRPPGKTHKVKGVDVTLNPFQMVISELKTNLKKGKSSLVRMP